MGGAERGIAKCLQAMILWRIVIDRHVWTLDCGIRKAYRNSHECQ